MYLCFLGLKITIFIELVWHSYVGIVEAGGPMI